MARLAAQQVAGYYPCPQKVIELTMAHLCAGEYLAIVDPCAGMGEAAFALRGLCKSSKFGNSTLYLVELEGTRADAARKGKNYRDDLAVGDFFNLSWRCEKHYHKKGDLLWLNPPYETDPVHKRLEERFLQRAKDLLGSYGVLAFVVPHHALSASATTLSRSFTDFSCYRFPDSEWDAYKQVILFAVRGPDLPEGWGNQIAAEQIQSWAKNPEGLPILGSDDKVYQLPHNGGFSEWEIAPLDLKGLDYNPWVSDRGPIAGIHPPDELLSRTYEVVSKPRAAHISAALAAGIFNGIRITPDDSNSDLPPLLVKGVFNKEYRKVEDKINSKGDKVAELQVQQPRLSVTTLNLNTMEFETLDSDGTAIRDLLEDYGISLMRGMLDSCPVLHDPNNDPHPLPLPSLKRPLYDPQAEAVRALVKLRRKYPDRGAIVLGEIGSGKTSVALVLAKALGHRKILVMCPPHLLTSWANEIDTVLGDATTYVLDGISDVEAFAKHEAGMAIALLSREKAKLHHGWKGLKAGQCPKCGNTIKKTSGRKRARCQHVEYKPTNRWAKWLSEAAPFLRPYIAPHPIATHLAKGRFLQKMGTKKWEETPTTVRLLEKLSRLFKKSGNYELRAWLAWLYPPLAESLLVYKGSVYRNLPLLAAMPQGRADEIVSLQVEKESSPWGNWSQLQKQLTELRTKTYPTQDLYVRDGVIKKSDIELRDGRALTRLLDHMLEVATFSKRECGEPLYSAEPPARIALSTWINKRYSGCYDMIIVDEAHEYSSRDSAQTGAAQRLMGSGAYSLILTGSLMNGYASSLYMNMYQISPRFRAEYGRDNLTRFIDRYGYWKQIVSEKDLEGKIVEFGANSDRVIRSARRAGVAPGVLPLFQLEYVLGSAVTLQKEDLDIHIPPRTDSAVDVMMDNTMSSSYRYLFESLKAEIQRTKFTKGLAGKLWGAMARLPSFLDLACVGNTDEGDAFELRWPENVEGCGGKLIASVPLCDPDVLLPKEERLIETLHSELAEGRKVIVLCWHTRLIERLEWLIRGEGFKTAVLDPNKVGTKIRQAWIDKQTKAGIEVLICNPIVIQTGLNNLVNFATELWVENPMCNAIVFRQASGRVDRIGQTKPSRVVLFKYADSAQEAQHTLLMHKVGVSAAVDGLDPEEALRAAGVIDSQYVGMSVGRQLYNMLTQEDM